MKDAEEFVQSQRLNLTRATEGLRLAEVGYQQGIKTQVEVIDAQSALTTARVNYYEAIYRHVVAKLGAAGHGDHHGCRACGLRPAPHKSGAGRGND
jgi:outer membrane protein TolC